MGLDVEDPTLRESVEVGMQCGVKCFYSRAENSQGYLHWQETSPDNVGKVPEDAETAKWALLVRYIEVHDDPRRTLAIHSIVVQSPLLKKLLESVLEDYPGVTVSLRRLEFSGKFEPLIHRWAELEDAVFRLSDAPEKDPQIREHAKLFTDVLRSELDDTIDAFQDMSSKGVITYEYLWMLFQPGALIFSQHDGQETVMKLCNSTYQLDQYLLSCEYIDWDGNKFGARTLNLLMSAYNGTRSITDLAAYPIRYHSNEAELSERLVRRGDKVEALAGSYFKAYDGVGWKQSASGGREKITVKGRVIIDTRGWNQFNPNRAVLVTPLNWRKPWISRSTVGGLGVEDVRGGGGIYGSIMPTDGHLAAADDESGRAVLTKEQKLICTPVLRGYSLKAKRWLNLFVESVREIEWSTRAFDSLVLPSEQKELILSFARSQQRFEESFDDLIQGKGKGVVFLLHGPPGVGKTLTAESIAEELRAPLYLMSAGDVGLDPRNIETELHNIFEMCTRWNAILLLDEADVFLEERSMHELGRNKLVTIFLRLLEYYQGIIFLATNRVKTLDSAFDSRIHCSIRYPELDGDSRRMVWKNLLTTSRLDSCVTDHQLDQLAQTNSNGRQIKNWLKMAQLLARSKEETFAHKHIQSALVVTQQFAYRHEGIENRV